MSDRRASGPANQPPPTQDAVSPLRCARLASLERSAPCADADAPAALLVPPSPTSPTSHPSSPPASTPEPSPTCASTRSFASTGRRATATTRAGIVPVVLVGTRASLEWERASGRRERQDRPDEPTALAAASRASAQRAVETVGGRWTYVVALRPVYGQESRDALAAGARGGGGPSAKMGGAGRGGLRRPSRQTRDEGEVAKRSRRTTSRAAGERCVQLILSVLFLQRAC